jgi:hypothetical protein
MGTFIAKGIDVIGSPSIGTRSGPGGGQITLNGGTQVWPDDAIIEFTTVRETGIGELNANSGFTGIRVFANYGDYLSGTPLYSYAPQNPGQVANVQGDLSGLGDTYVRFNANVLVSSSPDAPRLDQLFVAPGSNAGDNIGSLTINRNVDIDFNGDGRIAGRYENGNGLFYPGLSDLVYICFAAGTRIATATGEVAVETIRPGARVLTRDRGLQTVTWVGQRRIARPGAFAMDMRPVRIAAGALGPGMPARDLVLSPNHRVLVRGPAAQIAAGEPEVLVAAKHLAHLPGVTQAAVGAVTYVHLLFERHEVLLSDGAWTESFQPGDISLDGVGQAQRAEILALFPELATTAGLGRFQAARKSLKRHEARLLVL